MPTSIPTQTRAYALCGSGKSSSASIGSPVSRSFSSLIRTW